MKLIEALALLKKTNAADRLFPVDLICGFTSQPLTTFLSAHLQSRLPGRRVAVRGGRFDDLTGNLERYLRDPSGAASLVLEWADLDSRLGWRQHGGWGRAQVKDVCSGVEQRLGILHRLLADSAQAGAMVVALPSLSPAPVEPVPGGYYGELQRRLDALVAWFASNLSEFPHIRLVNPSRLAILSPPHQRLIHHTDVLAGMMAELLQPTPPMKGIITDLDQTVWAGILGEVGVDRVAWDLDHHAAHHGAYQQMLQSLADSGVLVAVASKNDGALVQEALKRPDILLRANSVFPIEAHWEPKSTSVTRILRAWNIAADSVVFIDDSPLELAEVQNAHPGIKCRLFSQSPDQVGALIGELADLFGKPADSEEDRLRLPSLRAASPRHQTNDGSESLEQVLSGADGVLKIVQLSDPPDPRALELVNKTNQFNLNGRRFNESEWLQHLRTPNRIVWMASYTDRFGPLGKISVLAGQLKGSGELDLDTWVLSCRAFGRRVEYAMIDTLFERHELRVIRFQFESNDRNGPLQEILGSLTGETLNSESSLTASHFRKHMLPRYMRVEYS
jgi:FkbH-like protein